MFSTIMERGGEQKLYGYIFQKKKNKATHYIAFD